MWMFTRMFLCFGIVTAVAQPRVLWSAHFGRSGPRPMVRLLDSATGGEWLGGGERGNQSRDDIIRQLNTELAIASHLLVRDFWPHPLPQRNELPAAKIREVDDSQGRITGRGLWEFSFPIAPSEARPGAP